MNSIKTWTKAVVAVLGALLAMTVPAAALSFNFSFTNVANGGGMVTGVIRGLSDNGFSAASSLEILSNSGGFGTGEYIGNPEDNIFEISAGQIVFADFFVFGQDNTPPAVTDSSFAFAINPAFPVESQIGLTNAPDDLNGAGLSAADFKISAVPIPLPAAFPLALAGLGSLIALNRRRRGA